MIAPRAALPRVRSRSGLATAKTATVATAVAVAGAAVLAGCGAGQQAQTVQVKAVNDAVNGSVGNLGVRAVGIKPPTSGPAYKAGSSAQLQVVIVNVSGNPDTLTAVSSPAFTGWSSSTVSKPSSLPLSSPTALRSSMSAPGTSAASGGTQQVRIPGNSRVSYGVPDARAVLTVTGIKHTLYPGEAVPIRFTFAKAGSVTVMAPVQLTSSPGTAVIGGSPSSPAGGGDAPEPTDTHTPETTTTPTPTDTSTS